ncbi:MAG: FAD-dependent oxidoreductase [Eggerthellaceae bacterium]|nr:FAD-dependent oxidoreductase [Eggerthellaceae bacterium]
MACDNQTAGVAIIGYGTAGVNAAIALRNAGYDGTVRVFSNTSILPYSPILTSYYAGGEKAYDECFPWSADELGELQLEVLENCPVTHLDPQAHVVSTPRGDFPYEKCVIATGATPTTRGFPEVEGDPDYAPIVLRSMDDAERLKAAIEAPSCKRFLVSGASMVALKTLEACLNHGLECTLVGVNPHVLDFNALPEAAERFEKGLREKGVELRLGQKIEAVKRVDGGLQVTFSSGESDTFDEVSVAHGMRCNLDFLDEGALEIDRALVVDEFMRTSDPDVYAAGDVAQATELISGEKRIVGIWKNAALQGACAGAAIAAELASAQPDPAQALAGSIPSNTIAVNGTLFISAGTMELTPERFVEVREGDGMTVVYIFEATGEDARRLVGFNLVSDVDEPGGRAYDVGAMLTLRIERGCREKALAHRV